MRKRTRTILIVGFALFVCGLIVGGIGFLLGGMNDVALVDGKLKVMTDKDDDKWIEVDESFAAEDVSSISVDISMINKVKIERGASFSVKGKNRMIYGGLSARAEGGVLFVEDTAKANNEHRILQLSNLGSTTRKSNAGQVTVTVPESAKLEKLDVKLSFGDLVIDTIESDNTNIHNSTGDILLTKQVTSELSVESSFGDIHIDGLKADRAKIEGSNGDITLANIDCANAVTAVNSFGEISFDGIRTAMLTIDSSNGDIRVIGAATSGLKIDNSYGDVHIGGLLKGENKIEMSNGDVTLDLENERDDLATSIDADFGDITVDGKAHKSYESESSSGNSLRISSSFGDISLRFMGLPSL